MRDEVYKAPAGEMSSEKFARLNYNELRFMLDTFYGLREEHGIDNFGDYFGETGLLDDLTRTDPKAFDRAISKYENYYDCNKLVDFIHTLP
jgi:hypothetical protein